MTNLGHHNAAELIDGANRIVIKIGSALLFNPEKNGLQSHWLAGLSDDVARLQKAGKQVILVSSGAIALGRDEMGLARGKIRLDEKQAAAGIETITFEGADAETWLNTARDAGWAAVEEIDAPLAKELRACLTN